MTAQFSEYWPTLRLVNLFRILLGLIFSALYLLPVHSSWLQADHIPLFGKVALFYTLVGVLFLLLWLIRKPDFSMQLFWQLMLDIFFINLLSFATGHHSNEIAMLLLIPITISAYLMPQIYSFFFASIAFITLSIFSIAFYGSSQSFLNSSLQHGILGAILFASALVFSRIAQISRKNEQRAAQQKEELRNLEEINKKIINHLHSGIIIVDQKLTIKHINHAAEDFLQLGKHPLHKNLHYSVGKLAAILDNWQKLPHKRTSVFQQTPKQPKLRATIEPFSNNWIMVVLEKLSEINEELQQIKLSSLGRLTASIAHEIRNPLSAIKQATQLLEELDSSEQEKKLIAIIENNSNRLNLIVDKIMQLSKKQHFQPEEIDFKAFLDLFVYEFCMVEDFPYQQITIHIEDELPPILFDPTHLNQILWNLFNNSIKHSQKSKQQLSVCLHAKRKGTQHIEVSHCDNGVTIPQDRVESLFEPFYTSSSSGTGLGLYICKELCNINHADLIYYPGQPGNCFKIITPVSKT